MILDEIVSFTRHRVAEAQNKKSFHDVKLQALAIPPKDFSFEAALLFPELGFICELKKASPATGLIDADFSFKENARLYEAAGATCLSVHTEPNWYLGSRTMFRNIRQSVDLPLLRKDFIVDEYQLYESRILGADAVNLIVSILEPETLTRFLQICDTLGMAALVEVNTAEEIQLAEDCGARIVGVDNRNREGTEVNPDNAVLLRDMVPRNSVYIAESGIRSPEDVMPYAMCNSDAVLVGEALTRAEDPSAFIAEMRRVAAQVTP